MICVEIHWDKVLEHFLPDHLDHSIISFCSHSYLCWARSCEFGRPAGRSGVCWDGRFRFGRWRSKAQTCEATKCVWCHANHSFLHVAKGHHFGHLFFFSRYQQVRVLWQDTSNEIYEDLMGLPSNVECSRVLPRLCILRTVGTLSSRSAFWRFWQLSAKVQRTGATYALWSHQKLAAAAGHTRARVEYKFKELEFFLPKICFFVATMFYWLQ